MTTIKELAALTTQDDESRRFVARVEDLAKDHSERAEDILAAVVSLSRSHARLSRIKDTATALSGSLPACAYVAQAIALDLSEIEDDINEMAAVAVYPDAVTRSDGHTMATLDGEVTDDDLDALAHEAKTHADRVESWVGTIEMRFRGGRSH